jgi:hypothetical protein
MALWPSGIEKRRSLSPEEADGVDWTACVADYEERDFKPTLGERAVRTAPSADSEILEL